MFGSALPSPAQNARRDKAGSDVPADDHRPSLRIALAAPQTPFEIEHQHVRGQP
jgi:hypothetical protein